jgi:hypothetical protein
MWWPCRWLRKIQKEGKEVDWEIAKRIVINILEGFLRYHKL